jgi:hypothetical protein
VTHIVVSREGGSPGHLPLAAATLLLVAVATTLLLLVAIATALTLTAVAALSLVATALSARGTPLASTLAAVTCGDSQWMTLRVD